MPGYKAIMRKNRCARQRKHRNTQGCLLNEESGERFGMRKVEKVLAAMTTCILLGGCTGTIGTNAMQTIRVDPRNISGVNDGVFEGWGTSLCWWANRIGYSDSLSNLAAVAFCNRVV